MNTKDKIFNFFEKVATDLDGLPDDYFLIGSGALVMSGVPLEEVADIDLLTTQKSAGILRKKWADKIMEGFRPSHADLFRSDFTRYDFGEIQVEVMGNLQINKGSHWVPLVVHRFQFINISGCKIKLPTLKEQFRIFKFFGRPKDLKKAALIQKYL